MDYNNSPYHQTTHHHHAIHNPERQHDYLSSYTSSRSSILSFINPIFFYDYIFSNDHHPPSKQRTAPSPNIQPSPSPNTPIPSPTNVPTMKPSSTSISFQYDDSFVCTKAETQLNLPIGDNIATVKVDNHYRILFHNVNSLEISTGQHTLDNTCNGISSYEIYIACLTKTNTHWKHQRGESTLRYTSK